MAHADLTFSLMDADLVEGMIRAILALHQEDVEGSCLECRSISPCSTVRIIASMQDAAVSRVADPADTAWKKFMKRPSRPIAPIAAGGIYEQPLNLPKAPESPSGTPSPKTHNFKYPECPEFSGGICPIHHGQPVTKAS